MKLTRIRSHDTGPKVRPMTAETEAEVIAGQRESMRQAGYDWPVRKARRANKSNIVTLPVQVREYLELSSGDWLAFGSTQWRGLFGLVKISQKRAEDILKSIDERQAVPIRKVQWSKRQASIIIPSRICENMQIECGDDVIFVPQVQRGIVGMGVLKRPDDPAGTPAAG